MSVPFVRCCSCLRSCSARTRADIGRRCPCSATLRTYVSQAATARPASRRFGTPSFASTAETWCAAVRVEMNSAAAMSALLAPSPSSLATSSSRSGESAGLAAVVRRGRGGRGQAEMPHPLSRTRGVRTGAEPVELRRRPRERVGVRRSRRGTTRPPTGSRARPTASPRRANDPRPWRRTALPPRKAAGPDRRRGVSHQPSSPTAHGCLSVRASSRVSVHQVRDLLDPAGTPRLPPPGRPPPATVAAGGPCLPASAHASSRLPRPAVSRAASGPWRRRPGHRCARCGSACRRNPLGEIQRAVPLALLQRDPRQPAQGVVPTVVEVAGAAELRFSSSQRRATS